MPLILNLVPFDFLLSLLILTQLLTFVDYLLQLGELILFDNPQGFPELVLS